MNTTTTTAPGNRPMQGERPVRAAESEAELIARLSRGEDRAWESVIRDHGGPLLAAARRILGSEDGARDAVQSAFGQAFKAIRDFEGGSGLSTWLYRLAVNEALVRLRSRTRRGATSIDGLLPRFHEAGAHAAAVTPWPAPDPSLLKDETCAQVRRCIDRLPTDYRVVLMLRDIDELATSDVASLLGITPDAVRTRLHRARMALRTLLDPLVIGLPSTGPGALAS